jgi:hypothetical protein
VKAGKGKNADVLFANETNANNTKLPKFVFPDFS